MQTLPYLYRDTKEVEMKKMKGKSEVERKLLEMFGES